MKLVIKEVKESVMLKTTAADGSYYLNKSATTQKSFWNKQISAVCQFSKKDSAIKKLYTVIQKSPEYAFYNEDDVVDFEDESDVKEAKFAKFFITDEHGKVIEDISDEVKKYLLSDGKFISGVMDDLDDDDY